MNLRTRATARVALLIDFSVLASFIAESASRMTILKSSTTLCFEHIIPITPIHRGCSMYFNATTTWALNIVCAQKISCFTVFVSGFSTSKKVEHPDRESARNIAIITLFILLLQYGLNQELNSLFLRQ